MKQEIINFLSNLNISYTIFSILFLIVTLLFLSNKKISGTLIQMYIILYVAVAWIGFYYLNDIFNSIFSLKYLSVKLYLILLIIGNIIMLITINKNIKKPYKITNYTLFISNIIILSINIIIIIANKFNNFIIGSISDAAKLIDINFIIFIIYLNTICLIYIFKYIIEKIKVKKTIKESNADIIKEIVPQTNIEEEHIVVPNNHIIKEENNVEGFYIDGIDCSIIFEDSDKDTILKNYYILLNDINAKLVNGYTLQENIKIKKIINKLNIKDLNNIDLDINKLSKITIDEYNLLKKYLNNIGINI